MAENDAEDWFATGEEEADRREAEADRRKEESDKTRFYRFWMPGGATQHITFVDDDLKPHPMGFKYPFMFVEHQLQLNGNWKNWFTCIAGTKGPDGEKQKCPLCQGGNQPAECAAYTIIDHNSWKDKNGKEHKDELKLYVVKSKGLKVVRRASAKKKGLRGWKVEVTRTDGDAINTGDQFDFEDRVDLPADLVAPDYRQLFKPKKREELLAVVGDVKGDEDRVRF